MTSTYLTVAIPYVNAAPHVGYAYELVLADICARARRARPDETLRFLGGTDDYSLKNVVAAEAAGVPSATSSPVTPRDSRRCATPCRCRSTTSSTPAATPGTSPL